MKLSELNESIATACALKPKVVAAVQKETFRQLLTALEKGERIQVPEFGLFTMKGASGEGDQPSKPTVRFKHKAKPANADAGEDAERVARRKAKRKKAQEAGSGDAAAADDRPVANK